jgi:hypothetical protein
MVAFSSSRIARFESITFIIHMDSPLLKPFTNVTILAHSVRSLHPDSTLYDPKFLHPNARNRIRDITHRRSRRLATGRRYTPNPILLGQRMMHAREYLLYRMDGSLVARSS